ncbi:hypothetical protein GOODEAATRI_008850 [Goodea atripinnis]|uniref:Uncharacterized protein n=1 Tax=Goodea atripinnis TaxID=208336 RepID=A0ABV0PCJ9_9TELE
MAGHLNIAFHKFLLDGMLASGLFAVRHVKTKVSPFIRSRWHPRWPHNSRPVGDCDGVTDTKVYCLHDPLTLQLPARAPNSRHCRGSHVAAGAKQLLAVVFMVVGGVGKLMSSSLFHVLQTSPDCEA